MLFGRGVQQRRIVDLLARARDGTSGTLVLVGEPGIGKTALLDYAVAEADAFEIARARGVESEAELPFAALFELCRPFLDRLDRLEPQQAAALRVTFGLGGDYQATGFAIGNEVLIIAGALDGASGFILSIVMSRAMNRSFTNVLFGAFGSAPTASTRTSEGLVAAPISAEDAALQLAHARSVIVVPGYGMAVAQAQHQIRELAELIEKNGGEVRYAIHPVAGRMPGHMNVLLAEANVPYDRLYEMDEINDRFEEADVALVIGANDVVNPAARTDPGSPIYGMPILNADKAKRVIVLKRSMATGFAGIENDLFYAENSSLLFGDAKDSLQKLIGEIKTA